MSLVLVLIFEVVLNLLILQIEVCQLRLLTLVLRVLSQRIIFPSTATVLVGKPLKFAF